MNVQATQSLLPMPSGKRNELVPAADAARLIHDGDTVAVGGLVGSGVPEALVVALKKRFLSTGKPPDLPLLYAAAG